MNPTIGQIMKGMKGIDWDALSFVQRVQAVSAALGFAPDEEWTFRDGSAYAKWRTSEGIVRLESGGYCIRVGQDYPKEPKLLGLVAGHGVARCEPPLKGCWYDPATGQWWLGSGPQAVAS